MCERPPSRARGRCVDRVLRICREVQEVGAVRDRLAYRVEVISSEAERHEQGSRMRYLDSN
jgi:hypothetical protein